MSSSVYLKVLGPVRFIIAALLLLIGLNALAGGYYGISGAPGVPLEWLDGSPFSSYFVPGLVLFSIVGIGCVTSGILLFFKRKSAYLPGVLSGVILIVWIVTQLIVIGYVSFLQPLVFIIGLIIIAGIQQLHKAGFVA